MKQSETNYEYEIDSTLDLDEVLEEIDKQLKPQTGILTYHDGDKEFKELLGYKKLKKEFIEKYNGEMWPSIDLGNLELGIGSDENSIEISSKIKLNLENIDEVKEIKK